MKKQSFITGAFLLAAATALGKVFSAIFKIPLDRFFLHADGMATFNGVYNIYMFFFAVATAGIPLAISRMIASCTSEDEENRIISTSTTFTTAFMGIFAFLIFIFADAIASFIGMPECASSFRVMAPALIFCAFTATLRGYFQGKMSMLPSALGQVTDSFGRFSLGLIMAFAFSAFPIGIKSAGAMAGVPFGAFLSALVLVIGAKKAHLHIKPDFSPALLKKLLLLALPITLTASMHAVFNMADTVSVVPFLTYLGYDSAQSSFGCLSRAAMLYALPVSISTSVAASVLPAVADSEKTGNAKKLAQDVSLAIRLVLLISVPCSAGFMAIPKGVLHVLFENSSDYMTLSLIALSAVFLSVAEVFSCILQGMGKTRPTVIASICAVGTKVVFNYVFMFLWGVNGAALSTTVSYLVFTAILLFFIFKHTSIRLGFVPMVLKPLFCGALCFLTAYFASLYISPVMVILVAALVYIPSVFCVKLVTIDEINQIFSGHKMEGQTNENPV